MDDVTIFRFVAACAREAAPGAAPRMPWAKLASSLPGRSDNAVKNRYYSSLRRLARRAAIVMGHHPMPEAVGPTAKRVLSRATQEDVTALKAAKTAFDSGNATQWTPAVAASLWGSDFHIAQTLTGSDAPHPTDIMAHCNTRGGRAARYLQHRRDKGDAIRKAQSRREKTTPGTGGQGTEDSRAVDSASAPAPRERGAAGTGVDTAPPPERAPRAGTKSSGRGASQSSDASRSAPAPGAASAAPPSTPAAVPPAVAEQPTPAHQQ